MTAIEDVEVAVLQGTGPDVTAQESWRVTDERSAEWALLKIRMARKDADDRTAAARDMIDAHRGRIAELEVFVDIEKRRAEDTARHFEALLIAWHRQRYADDPKHTASIKLAGGILESRAARDRVELDDEAKLYDHDAFGEFGDLVVKVDRRHLLAYIKRTGEIPAGARLIAATEDDRTYRVNL